MRQVLSRPSPVKKEHRRKNLSKFFWAIIILIALFVGLGFLSHLPRIMINEISVTGIKVLDKDSVSAETLSYLSGNKALLYARGNIFLFSKKDVSDFIQEKFPRVYSVTNIGRTGQRLLVDIEEREGAYLWCGHEKPDYLERFADKNCFFIDQKGFIFDEAPFFTNGVYFTVYGGIPKDVPPIGETVQLQNSMKDMSELSMLLAGHNFPVHSLVIVDSTQYQLLLDIYTTNGDFAKIIFNEDESLQNLREKIDTALRETSFIEELKIKKEKLEYVDTRFKNRVFYKFAESL